MNMDNIEVSFSPLNVPYYFFREVSHFSMVGHNYNQDHLFTKTLTTNDIYMNHEHNYSYCLITLINYLWQLFGNITTNKDCLQVNPQILHNHPVLNDVRRVGQIRNPFLNRFFEWCIIPEVRKNH